MLPIDPDNFDIDALDAAADAYEKVPRASQRREARKLQPLIERVLTRQPAMPTNDVLKELRAKYRGGSLPTTATFVREVGSICKEVKAARLNEKGGVRKSKSKPRSFNVNTRPAHGPISAPVANPSAPSLANLDIQPFNGEPTHPLQIHAGEFGGRVYVHGRPIQSFFSAVEKRLDDRTLKALALEIEADPTARAKLIDLHPKDRAVFDAALALS